MPAQTQINGRYELKDTLGQGGMGVVYRAYDSSTRRHVALKTMHDSANPLAVEMFSKEWHVLATISHPNIVDILDCGEFENKGKPRPFFVMPLLPGKTLEQLIHSSSERLTINRIVEILSQTCRGLQAAHERGLVHRDLKPSNIFVMEDDTAKIIDFGVVHLTGSQSLTGLKGTVQYMAPEQLDLKPATPQSDIFSLGVVGYEAITGRKPFARKGEVETAEAVRLHIPPPASEINPSVSDQVSRVIHKAMAKQPWNRFGSAREFGDTLQKALRGEMVLDTAKIRPRIERAAKAFNEGDIQFASDILNELEAEGNIDTEMKVLRMNIDQTGQQRAIRQLLENARTRLEQEEYPLALQKVQEVLRLDPSNVEAIGMRHEIDSQRSEKQIENWLRLAREHLDRGAFGEARQGLQEALKLNRNDSRINALLTDLTRQEQENSKARQQKEHLYSEAKEAFQNGEISTALSKLERVLELNRRVPDRTSPERDALYQTFYNQVRSENDANRIAYEEARRYLAEKDFAKALYVCQENLRKYPGQALFHALKLEIGERERQEIYSYIAETERRLDAEPDLDRKLSIAKEAADRYPQEEQFKKSLKLVRDRRDLVLSIVAKTRQYEERGQFAEAIGQWEILRGIYPQYPGLQFELDQLKRRRDSQSREEAKSRWVEQTDLALTSGDFERARDLAIEALAEFPGDAELAGLESLSLEGISRRQEAQRLLAEGQQLCASNRFDDGLTALETAAKLDEYDPAVRAALINALVQRAQALISTDWAAAEPLNQKALDLDTNNPAAKSIRAQIQDHRRRHFVDNCLAQARDLRTRGDYAGALAKIESGLKLYPGEPRLAGFEAQLRKQRSQDLQDARGLFEEAQRAGQPKELEPLFARTVAITNKYPGDSEFIPLAQAVDQRLTEVRSAQTHADANSGPEVPPEAPERPPVPPPAPPKQTSYLVWGSIAAIPLLIIAAWLIGRRPPPPPPPTHASQLPVSLNVAPVGASVRVDGNSVPITALKLKPGNHSLEVSMPGYRTVSQVLRVKEGMSPISVELDPESQRLQIHTNFPSGKVLIDDHPAGDLDRGTFSKDDLSLAEHNIQVVDGGRELIRLHISATAARAPQVSAVKNDIVVLGTFGDGGKIYSGNNLHLKTVDDSGSKSIPPEGLDVSLANGPDIVLTDGHRPQPYTIESTNYPLLAIYANVDADSRPSLSITSNVDDPQISVNGKPVTWRAHKGKITGRLDPGTYRVELSKPGYDGGTADVVLANGDKKQVSIELKQQAVYASLVIEGGVPGAQLSIDDKPVGQLDAVGALAHSQVEPGLHKIGFQKENYEYKSFTRPLVGAQTLRISAGDAAMVPFGRIEFRVSPARCEIHYQRLDESQPRTAENNATVSVQRGRYQVFVSAEGRKQKQQEIDVDAGKASLVTLELEAVQTAAPPKRDGGLSFVADPAKWSSVNEWIQYQGPSYGWLRTSSGSYSVIVRRRAGKFLRGDSSIDFVVGYADGGKNKISYRIGKDGSLTRKLITDGATKDAKSSGRVMGEEPYSLSIAIDAKRVVVRDSNGKVLDDCRVSDFDATAGKVGFKSGLFLNISR